MYSDEFGELVCEYWGLKELKDACPKRHPVQDAKY